MDSSLLDVPEPSAPVYPLAQRLLWAPEGRFFPGAAIDAQFHQASSNGRVLVQVPDGYREHAFLHRPSRGLVIGQVDHEDGPRLYGLDTRYARRHLRYAEAGARSPIPSAFVLDELTFAVLWAVVNMDEALLADDAMLEESRRQITGYAPLPRSSVSRDVARDLSPTAKRGWAPSSARSTSLGTPMS